jgi:hypothetical protein
MPISDEGLVSGSVNRAELAAAYAEATDEAVRANLAAAGAEHGMYVEGDELVDSSAPPETEAEAEVADADGPTAPPLGGPGSGREAWVAWADHLGVEVTEDMSRDDIVAAIADLDETEEDTGGNDDVS